MPKIKKMEIIFIVLSVIIVSAGVFFFGGKPKKSFVEFPGHNLKAEVELAENVIQQIKGLMYRDSLAPNTGMLFVFKNEAPRTFWMKNVKIPLDLIFISSDKKIVEIKENFEPCQKGGCSAYKSQKPARYVLEVNAGFAKSNNIQLDDIVTF